MTSIKSIPTLLALLSLPALAQTTTVQPEPGTSTTVQSSPGSTTVQTQPQQPAPGTQVVVNPPADPPPPATTRVRTYDSPVVVEEHRRAPMAIIATDALYGGVAGVLVGGGIAPRIIERLAAGGFVTAFRDKGRLAPLLESLPINVALNPRAPLLGAARVAADMV